MHFVAFGDCNNDLGHSAVSEVQSGVTGRVGKRSTKATDCTRHYNQSCWCPDIPSTAWWCSNRYCSGKEWKAEGPVGPPAYEADPLPGGGCAAAVAAAGPSSLAQPAVSLLLPSLVSSGRPVDPCCTPTIPWLLPPAPRYPRRCFFDVEVPLL
jgi:hypothetical protein